MNAERLVFRNSCGIGIFSSARISLPLAGDPVQRVDRRQDLHRERLVARLALLGDDQVADLVGLVDQHLGGALQVAGAVAQRQLGPERLHLGDLVDHRLDVAPARSPATEPSGAPVAGLSDSRLVAATVAVTAPGD